MAKVNALQSVVNTVFASEISNKVEFVTVVSVKGQSLMIEPVKDVTVENLLMLIKDENVTLFARPAYASKFEAGKALAKQIIKFENGDLYKENFGRKTSEIEDLDSEAEAEASEFDKEIVQILEDEKPKKKSKKATK